jgi:hypothetical protein
MEVWGALSGIPVFFYWGVAGSVCAETASALKECKDRGGQCPPLYKTPSYVIIRSLVAIAAGIFPVAMDAQNILTAFYLGISAPIALDRLSRGLQQVDTAPAADPPTG